MTWKPNVTVAAVIEHERRFLLVKEKIAGKHVYNQPAGHLEEGETLVEAVTREVLEETACHFEPHALVAIQLWRHPHNGITFLRFGFCGQITHHDPTRPLDPDIVATGWFERHEIDTMRNQLRSPLVWESIVAYESGHRIPLDILQTFFEPGSHPKL